MSNLSIILQQQISNLENSPSVNQQRITLLRGKLIRQLRMDIKNASDVNTVNQIKTVLNQVLQDHQEQLNTRLRDVKQNSNSSLSQLPKEFGLKIKKTVNSIRQLKQSRTKLELLANSAKLSGNILSTTGTVAKAPVIATLNIISKTVPTIGKIMVQPLQVPVYLFSKFINPDAPYNSRMITNIGNGLGKILASTLNFTQNNIRKI